MNETETLAKIQSMNMDEKIAALSPTDKAYIRGYIERAVLENRKYQRRNQRKKPTENKERK